MTRRCIPIGPDIDGDTDRLVAQGVIEEGDAAAVKGFAAFLRDAGAHRDPAGRPRPIPTAVMWKHRALLGVTDDDVREIAARRGEPDPTDGGDDA